MNLEKNYELLDAVSDDGIRTLKAREKASGRTLEVHLFMKAEDQALFEQLQGLPLSARRALLEFGSELKIPYVVTDPVTGETNARAWFTTLLKPMPNTPEPKPQPIKASVWKTGTPLPDPLFPEPEAAAEPGEFTRMFQVPSAAVPAPKVETNTNIEPKLEPKPETNPEPKPEPKAQPEPQPAAPEGEFTRMFQAPVLEPADEKTRLFQVPVPAAPPVPEKEPGEFTRLFQSMQPNPAAPPETAAKPAGPGEFTRMFQSPLSPGVQNPNARADVFPAVPAAPPAPPQNRGGEFTQLFGTPSAGVPEKPVAPLGGGFGQSATGAFASARPIPQGIPQAGPPGGQGPGQFTKMMSAGSAPTLGQQQPQQQPGAKAAANSKMPLIVILGSLALFAILIVLFFAMRR